MDTKLLSELQYVYNSYPATDTNHVIARFFIENLFHMDSVTINDVSKACFTSNATISRFARNVGCDNFQVLKQGLASENRRTAKELIIDNKEDLKFNKGDDQKELEDYIDRIHVSLKGMADSIDFKAIDELNAMIHDYEDVYFCGTQLPGMLSNYIQFMLFNCGKVTHGVWTLEQHQRMIKEITGREDKVLVVIFSLNGNYTRVYSDVVMKLIDLNVHKALITQDPNVKRIKDFETVVVLGKTENSKIGRYKLQLFLEVLLNRYTNTYGDSIFK